VRAVENTLLIAWLKFYPDFRRQPYVLITQAAISAGPVFFILLSGSAYAFNSGLVGAMISVVSFLALTTSIQDVASDRYVKLREIMVSMPVHPLSYALGVSLAPLLASLPGLFFFMTIAGWLGLVTPSSLGMIVAALMLSWLSISMMGFIISTYLAKFPPFMLTSLGHMLSLGLVFVPPVYYSESVLGQFSWVSYLFPTSNAASLLRGYSGLSTLSLIVNVLHWLILTTAAIAFTLLASFKARWREK
jgi:ABC-type multidrug transport system permease subunit